MFVNRISRIAGKTNRGGRVFRGPEPRALESAGGETIIYAGVYDCACVCDFDEARIAFLEEDEFYGQEDVGLRCVVHQDRADLIPILIA